MSSRFVWFALSCALPWLAARAAAQPVPAPSKPAAVPASAAPAVSPTPKSAPPAAPPPPAPPAASAAAAPAPPPGASAAAPAPLPPPTPVVPPLPPPEFQKVPPRGQVRHTYTTSPREPRRYGNAGAPLTVGMGAALRFRSDPGYEQLKAKDHQTEFEMFASYDVYQPVRRLVLAAGISYRNGQLGDDDSLRIVTNAVQADAILRCTLTRWLYPQLRLGLGVQLSRADFKDETGTFRAHDHTAGVAGSAGAGLLIQTPPRLFESRRGRLASLALGFLVEGGYAFAGAADYHLRVDSDDAFDGAKIGIGKLDLGGAYLRLAGVLRI